MGSEMTAAAAGTVGKVRRDPMAMLPFCGYNMGDYFRHWLDMQRKLTRDAAHLPRQLVPQGRRRQVHLAGLRREHARAEMDRSIACAAGGRAKETPIGWMPRYEDIDWTGLDFPKEKFEELQAFDRARLARRGARARGALHRPARASAEGNGLRARAADLPDVTTVELQPQPNVWLQILSFWFLAIVISSRASERTKKRTRNEDECLSGDR